MMFNIIAAQFASIFMLLFLAHGVYRDLWLATDTPVLILIGKVCLTVAILFMAGIMCSELIKNVAAGL